MPDKKKVWRRRNQVIFYVCFSLLVCGAVFQAVWQNQGHLDRLVVLPQESFTLEKGEEERNYFRTWIVYVDNRIPGNQQEEQSCPVHFPEIGAYGKVSFANPIYIGSYVCWWLDVEGELGDTPVPKEGLTLTKVMLGEETYDLGSLTILPDQPDSLFEWQYGSSASNGQSLHRYNILQDCTLKDAVFYGTHGSRQGEVLSILINGTSYEDVSELSFTEGDTLSIETQLTIADPFSIHEGVLELVFEDSQGKKLQRKFPIGDTDFYNDFEVSEKELKAFLKGKGAL
ncbi:MAG: hypothetical protein ACLSX5_13430 [Lachnospiraceae bacterium]